MATDICALTSEDCQKIYRYWEFISVSSYHKDAKGDPFQLRKLMSTYGFFPILDRNQNQNFFFVLSRKWSLMKTIWFQQLNGIKKKKISLQPNKICEYSFYLFLIYIMVSQTELIRWRIWMPRFLSPYF